MYLHFGGDWYSELVRELPVTCEYLNQTTGEGGKEGGIGGGGGGGGGGGRIHRDRDTCTYSRSAFRGVLVLHFPSQSLLQLGTVLLQSFLCE